MRNKHFISVLLVVAFVLSVWSGLARAEAGFGSLKVIADNDTAKIYVDGNFEGTGIASVGKIIVGNHYVQSKIDNIPVFEEMVAVKEGEQSTVVAKGGAAPLQAAPLAEPAPAAATTPAETKTASQAPRSNTFGLDVSYGSISLSWLGTTTTTKTSPFGVGLFGRIPIADYCNLVIGGHYVSKVEGVQLSYAYVDLAGRTGGLVGSIGINYPFLTIDGASSSAIQASAGYQAMLGYCITDYLMLGAKYIITNTKLIGADLKFSQAVVYLATL